METNKHMGNLTSVKSLIFSADSGYCCKQSSKSPLLRSDKSQKAAARIDTVLLTS